MQGIVVQLNTTWTQCMLPTVYEVQSCSVFCLEALGKSYKFVCNRGGQAPILPLDWVQDWKHSWCFMPFWAVFYNRLCPYSVLVWGQGEHLGYSRECLCAQIRLLQHYLCNCLTQIPVCLFMAEVSRLAHTAKGDSFSYYKAPRPLSVKRYWAFCGQKRTCCFILSVYINMCVFLRRNVLREL